MTSWINLIYVSTDGQLYEIAQVFVILLLDATSCFMKWKPEKRMKDD